MTQENQPSSLADIVTASGHIAYDWDLVADTITWQGPWQDLFGNGCEPPHDAQTFASLIYPDDHHLVFTESPVSFDREYRLRLPPDGHLMWITEHGVTSYRDGHAVRQQGLLRIVDSPENNIRLPLFSSQDLDSLTGLPNRATMLAQMDQVLRGLKHFKQISAYLTVSIDKMAFVNEAIGMKAADTLLLNVAERLTTLVPPRTLVARVGGDVFGILLPGQGQVAQGLAESILNSFRNTPVETSASPYHISVSIGGVRLVGQNLNTAEIMIRAEQALHEARSNGRNQYIEYRESAARIRETRERLNIGERIKQALKRNEIHLAFQPVTDTETGAILFYEALARVFDDDGQMMAADKFIPIVEQHGLAPEFDRHILDLAVHEMEKYDELHLAVNISGLTASEAAWPQHIQQVLKQHPHVARRLIVEITETAAIINVEETQRLIQTLESLGGKVALDDFGAGSTSIRHLRTLKLAIMKIDRELIVNLTNNKEQQHLVRMLNSIAHGFNLKTIAEGVETEELAQWLRQEKIDMMQGYYFGRPSLDRPWLEMKNNGATEIRLETILGEQNGVTEVRVASLIQPQASA